MNFDKNAGWEIELKSDRLLRTMNNVMDTIIKDGGNLLKNEWTGENEWQEQEFNELWKSSKKNYVLKQWNQGSTYEMPQDW